MFARLAAVLLIMLTLGRLVSAESTNATIIRLTDATADKMARERSAEIMAANAQALAQEADARLATSYIRPALIGSAGYTRSEPETLQLDNPTLTALGLDQLPLTREDDYRASIMVDQHVYGFGRWSAAKQSADAR
jgi:hypothetical protein